MANFYPQNTQYNGTSTPSAPQIPKLSATSGLKAATSYKGPAMTAPPASSFPNLAALGANLPDMGTLMQTAQQKFAAQMQKMKQKELQRSAFKGMGSSWTPPNMEALSAGIGEQVNTGAAPLPWEPVAPTPFEGDSQSLAAYNAAHPGEEMKFKPPSEFAGWAAPGPNTQIVKTGGDYQGLYVEDPDKPDTIVHSDRNWDIKENKRILGGRSPYLFQIDHTAPIFAGGADILANKEIYYKDDNLRKSSVQAVPYTLWFNFRNNPELAKKYGMTPLSLQQMRTALDNWTKLSTVGVPAADQNGQVPLDVAVNIWKSWNEPDKKGVWGTLKSIPGALGKAASSIFSSTPIVGPAAQGAFEGFTNEATLGYAKKALPGFYDENAREEPVKLDPFGNPVKEKLGPISQKIWGGIASGLGITHEGAQAFKEGLSQDLGDLTGSQTIKDLHRFDPISRSVGEAAGGLLGSLIAFKAVPNILQGGAKAIGAMRGAKTAAAVAEASGATKGIEQAIQTPGLLERAFMRFGIGGKATEAVLNTEKVAAEVAKSAEGLTSATKIASSSPWAWAEGSTKVPLVGDMFKAAVKTAQRKATFQNMGTMLAMNLIHQHDDRSMGATAKRALGDLAYGWFLGSDKHDLPGYLRVAAKSFGLSLFQSSFDNKPDLVGAAENAVLMAGLHGLGHKEARAFEKGTAEQQKQMEVLQEQLQQNMDKQLQWRGAKVLSQVLPENFKPPAEKFEEFDPSSHFTPEQLTPEFIKKTLADGTTALERLAAADHLKDENGKAVLDNGRPVSAWTDEDLLMAKSKLAAAARQLEYMGAPPEKQRQMELDDMKSWSELWKKTLNFSEPNGNPAARLALRSNLDYAFSDPNFSSEKQLQYVKPNPDAPVGVTQATGIGDGLSAASRPDFEAVKQALRENRLGSKVLIEKADAQGMKESVRRSVVSPEEAAKRDMTSDAGQVLKVSAIVKNADGSVEFVPMGFIPSEHRLNESEFALNKKPGEIEGGISTGKFEVYNLDKDTLGRWMDNHQTGAMLADIGLNGLSLDPKRPYVKVKVTEDNLARSIELFKDTHLDNPESMSLFQILSRAKSAQNPAEARKAVDIMAEKMPLEPAHELLSRTFTSGVAQTYAKTVAEPLNIVAEGLKTGDVNALMEAINSHYGQILDAETAQKWLSNPNDVRVGDIFNLMWSGSSKNLLNDAGKTAYKDAINGFFKGPEFVSSPLAGYFDQLPILGSVESKIATQRPVVSDKNAVVEPIRTNEMNAQPQEISFKNENISNKPNQLTSSPTTRQPLAENVTDSNIQKAEPTIETPVSKEGVPEFLDWTKEAKSSEPVKTFKRMNAVDKELQKAEPAPEMKSAESPSVVQGPPAPSLKEAERSSNSSINVSSQKAMEALETSGKRVVDGLDVQQIESDPHDAGVLDNGRYRITDMAFSAAQRGMKKNSEPYKLLERSKTAFSRENLKKKLTEFVDKNDDNLQKGIEDLQQYLVSRAKQLGKDAGVELPEVLNDELSKQAFKGMMMKIHGEKPRLVLQFKKGKLVSEAPDKMELPSPIDEKIGDFIKANPDVSDLSIVHVQSDNKFINEERLAKELKSKGYVMLGSSGNDANTVMAVKFNKALADRYQMKEGEKISEEDKMLKVLAKDVFGMDEKIMDDMGALNKRFKNLDNHDPKLDLRDENGNVIRQRHFIVDGEKVGDLGLIDTRNLSLPSGSGEASKTMDSVLAKILSDGGMFMPEKGFFNMLKQMGFVGERGQVKPSFVDAPETGGNVLMKGMIFPISPEIQGYIERKYGIKMNDHDVFQTRENVKLGKDKLQEINKEHGVYGYDAPSTSMRVKLTNEHRGWTAKFSPSIFSRVPNEAGLNEAFQALYKEPLQKFLGLSKELKESDMTNKSIKDILAKYKEIGVQIDEDDFATVDKMLKQGASGVDLWHLIDKSLAKKFKSEVMSGKMAVKGTHNYIVPDIGQKGGKQLISIENTPAAKESWGGFAELASLVRGDALGKKPKPEELVQTFNGMFGSDALSKEEAKDLLSGKNGSLLKVINILQDAKASGTLSQYGQKFLDENHKFIFLKPDEIFISRADHARSGHADSFISVRYPVTRLTAARRVKPLIAEDYGLKLGEGSMVASNHDVLVNKEGDFDGDAYSIFPEGKNGIPTGFGDYVEARRAKDGDVVLMGLDSFDKRPISEQSIKEIVGSAIKGGGAIGQSSTVARTLAAMEDSGMSFAGKKLKMTPEKERLVSQVQQESADAVNKKNLIERLQKSGFADAKSYLIDQLFELGGDPKNKAIREISRSMGDFQTFFKLADENVSLNNTTDLADQLKQALDLRAEILKSGGKVPPAIDIYANAEGFEAVPRVSAVDSQQSDIYASKKLREAAEAKYGKDALALKKGTPEFKVFEKVKEVQSSRSAHKRSFFKQQDSFLSGIKMERLSGPKQPEAFGDGVVPKTEALKQYGPFDYEDLKTATPEVLLKKYFKPVYNAETDAIAKAKEREVLDFYEKMKMSEGLDDDQIRRLTFALLTEQRANRNLYPGTKPLADQPYGREDVRRFNQMFDDDELASLYYGFRDEYMLNKKVGQQENPQ